MTSPPRLCTTCGASIDAGALYCLACGSVAPTETGAVPAEEPRPAGRVWDPEPRRREIQAALGAAFEVRRLVGRGGFGEVWAAFDVQLSRAVAIKVLRAGLATSAEFVERFRREARAVARLRHPGIVPIYHVGEAAGLTYFIMPLVDGVTLSAALEGPGGIAPDEAMRIIVEAAAALHEAHVNGVVHRDLKPENFMLEGAQRRVVLMDFGIAQVQGSETSGLTETGIVLGSPEYMSPEQATGRPLDARSDIYSFGVVAYRMLAGRLPFEGDTPRAMLAHHVLTAPQPLLPRASVPPAFADAVMRCLAKEPADRWQSTAELLGALHGQAPERPATRAEIPVARAPGRRGIRFAVPAALLLVVGAVALWPALRWRGRQQGLATALGAAALYRAAADSARRLTADFAAGDSAVAGLLERQALLRADAEARVDEEFGVPIEDSARWSSASRQVLGAARDSMLAAGLVGGRYPLGRSDVAGCGLNAANGALAVADSAPRDNCWWPVTLVPFAAAPVEYDVEFRFAGPPGRDAGLGLAWCLRAADCRVAFLWAVHGIEWGSHQPRTGLRAEQTGRAFNLAPGRHRLRVRWSGDVVSVRLDGRELLRRTARLDGAYLERPATVHFVVQNAAVTLLGEAPVLVAGIRK